MKKAFLIAAVSFLLLGCASQQIAKWASDTRPLAESGKLKWSEYYSQLYQQVLAAPIPNKGSTLENVNNMILISQGFEAGKISKDDFDYFQRASQAAQQKSADATDARSRAIFSAALQNMGNAYKSAADVATQKANSYQPPVRTSCQAFGNQFNCVSQ